MKYLVYDFEVFRYDWMMVAIVPEERKTYLIENSPAQLLSFYEEHKGDIWVGYNSNGYDRFILAGILCGFNAYSISDWIIGKGRSGWRYSSKLLEYPIISYDCMDRMRSLKQLEAFMGNDIEETSVPFDIDRPLTSEELRATERYCLHDVEQTLEVFAHNIDAFKTQLSLVKAFHLPIRNIGKAQSVLIAEILGARKQTYEDEFDVDIPDTLRLPDTPEFDRLAWWFWKTGHLTIQDIREHWIDGFGGTEKNRHKIPKTAEELRKFKYSQTLEMDICGVPHGYGWGGLHGARQNYHGEGHFIMADVTSLYPSLMIRYGYFSRSIADPKRYVDIYNTNLEMKKSGNPLRPAYKLICNMTYGCFKDRNNPMYDPRMANDICISGQLLITDLILKLAEGMRSFELIQTNTDGILFKYDGSQEEYDRADDIVYEWERRTGLGMEFSNYVRMHQKDVNNYVAISEEGKVKSKGAYVKKLSRLDNDLAILNEAVLRYLVDGTSVEDTVMGCTELSRFQKVVKVSSSYLYATHNGQTLKDKTHRVFASRNPEDGAIYKVKEVMDSKANALTLRAEKFAYTSEHVFIDNGDINGKGIPERLDRGWYIEEAKSRLRDFGIDI